jgi:hypothetical protein
MSLPGSLTLTLDAQTRRAERAVAAIALLAGAAAPCLIFSLAPAAFVYAACCVGVLAWGCYRAGWLGARHRIVAATWHADSRWTLSIGFAQPVDAVLLGDSRVTPGCVWLRWRTPERPWPRLRSMLLIASDLPSGELRRLGIRLRLEGSDSAAVPAFSSGRSVA